jgi:hypothetical protein
LRCVTEGIAQGQTILHNRLEIDFLQLGFGSEVPLAQAAMQVDGPSVLRVFEETLACPWL